MSLTARSKSPDSASLWRREPPILPAPIIPTLCKSPRLKLVEERPLGDALALLGAHLDVARCQQEDPAGHGLDVAIERAGEARAEVHHPATQVAVHVLEVEDHGLLALEAVGQALGVVEAGGLHHADPRGTLVGHGAQVRRVLPAGVALAPAGGLAPEEVPEGGAEGRRTFRPPEAPDRRTRLVIPRSVSVRVFSVAAVFFLLVIVIVVDAEAEPGRDALQTIPNSHLASSRAIVPYQCSPDPD